MSTRISVITATRNRRALLERALESVIAQKDQDFEHIVIDGMSTDGTDELLAQYPHLVVIREPDNGVYEAWNKGLRRASGYIICILNSDDEIPIGAFARIRSAIAANPDVELVSGAVEIYKENPDKNDNFEKRIIKDERILQLREQDIGPGIPITNGRYLVRRFIEKVGNFDERYRLIADRDFLLRAISLHPKHVWFQEPVYRYYAHAGSLTLSGSAAQENLARESLLAAQDGFREANDIELKNAYRRWHAWALFYVITHQVLRTDFTKAFMTAWGGFKLDCLWPSRIPLPLWRHLNERKSRRGRIVGYRNDA